VHLIETSTGLCTENFKSRTTIYHKLLEAMEENHERLERTLPGTKTLLRNGNWLGVAPFGYTTMGPKVVDFSLKREYREIVINREGCTTPMHCKSPV
jgi:site-specific DNA recombinase